MTQEQFTNKIQSRSGGGSFAVRIVREKACVYEIWLTQSDNRQAWFILEVERAKVRALEAAMDSPDTIDLRDYGKVLYSGWGDGPSEQLKAELRDKYGMYE